MCSEMITSAVGIEIQRVSGNRSGSVQGILRCRVCLLRSLSESYLSRHLLSPHGLQQQSRQQWFLLFYQAGTLFLSLHSPFVVESEALFIKHYHRKVILSRNISYGIIDHLCKIDASGCRTRVKNYRKVCSRRFHRMS